MTVLLVDTDILIAHLRGVAAARDWLKSARAKGRLYISAVSVAELAGGMRANEGSGVEALISIFTVEPITEQVGWQAGEYQRRFGKSHSGIGIADYLIAATAKLLHTEPSTLNIKHFPMFPGLTRPFELPRKNFPVHQSHNSGFTVFASPTSSDTNASLDAASHQSISGRPAPGL